MAQVDTLTWDQWYTLGSYDGVTWNEYDTSNSTMPFYWWPKKIQIDTNDNVVIAQTYNNGLIEFDGITATQYSSALGNFPDVWVNSLHIDDNGNRWVSTNSNGLLKINGGIVETIPTSEYILNNNRTTSVLVASDGKKWFAINDANNPNTRSGVFTLDTNNVWTSFELELDGIMGSPYAIEEDASGNIYVVGRFTTMKYNGNTWIETACEQGSSVRTDIAFDNFGNYWKGRDQSYIVKCDETFYEQISYGGNGHHSVEVDFADNIWIGTQYTIVKMDQNENYTTYGFSEIGPGSINDIEFDSQQHLWATGAHNLIEFDGTTWIFHPYPSMSYTTDIEIDNYDNVWVSFLGGVGRFDGSNWLVYDTSNTFFVDDYVVEISLDIPNNTLWGATYSGGIFSFTDSNLIAGIDEINTELKTNVYPNPASEIVNIDIDVIYAEDALITLIDLNGNLIKKQVSSGPNNILEIANVTPGFYLLKVASHGFEASKKLVIK
jgi:ligand-binding sensor domain-containing protein